MWLIKLGETTAARKRIPIRLVDTTDGESEETGLTPTAKVSQNGAAYADADGSVVEIGFGDYYYEADDGELDVAGFLLVRVVDAAANTFVGAAQIVAFDPYDAAALGLSKFGDIETDTQNIQGRLPASLSSGRMNSDVGAMQAGVVNAAAIATDAIDADAIKADAVTEIQSGLATAASIAALNNLSAAQVNAECDQAISDAALATASALASVATGVTKLLGLSGENVAWASPTFDGDGNLTSTVIRIYNSKSNADTNNPAVGLVAAYTVTATYSGGNLATYKMTLNP